MYLKRFAALLLVLAMLVPTLVACNGENGNVTTEPPVETTPENKYDLLASALGGYDLVRSEYASNDLIKAFSAFNADVEKLGYKFNDLKTDFYKEGVASLVPTPREILVGETNRPETQEFKKLLRYNDYGYALIGEKVVVFGYTDDTAKKAIELFTKDVLSAEVENDVLMASGTEKVIKATYDVENATINGRPFSEYTIVYPRRIVNGEAERAKALALIMSEISGFAVEAKKDSEYEHVEGKYEILIGETNRNVDIPSDLAEDEYYIACKDEYIVIGGGSALGFIGGINEFTAAASTVKDKSITVTLAESERKVSKEEVIKAMSFNVYVGNKNATRDARVLDMIKKYAPDILGVQEASPAWMNTLKNGLGSEYAAVGNGRDGGSQGEYSAIFYLKDKYTLIDSGTKWLSATPDKVSKFEESSLNRILTYAVFKRKSDGKTFVHINTHFDHTNEAARIKQAEVFAEFATKYKEYPMVLTGDFNATSSSQSHSRILDAGYVDSSKVALSKYTAATFHNYGSSSSIIDFCFVTPENMCVTKYKVCDEKINGDFASDHHPVYIEFILG